MHIHTILVLCVITWCIESLNNITNSQTHTCTHKPHTAHLSTHASCCTSTRVYILMCTHPHTPHAAHLLARAAWCASRRVCCLLCTHPHTPSDAHLLSHMLLCTQLCVCLLLCTYPTVSHLHAIYDAHWCTHIIQHCKQHTRINTIINTQSQSTTQLHKHNISLCQHSHTITHTPHIICVTTHVETHAYVIVCAFVCLLLCVLYALLHTTSNYINNRQHIHVCFLLCTHPQTFSLCCALIHMCCLMCTHLHMSLAVHPSTCSSCYSLTHINCNPTNAIHTYMDTHTLNHNHITQSHVTHNTWTPCTIHDVIVLNCDAHWTN